MSFGDTSTSDSKPTDPLTGAWVTGDDGRTFMLGFPFYEARPAQIGEKIILPASLIRDLEARNLVKRY